MRVLVLNGSARKDGGTAEMATRLKEFGRSLSQRVGE
jgi:multimeric flavodoxin WrbA